MAESLSDDQKIAKRKQFGNRFLTDTKNVFEHNAWDNVVWDEEQEEEARSRTEEHLKHLAPDQDIAKFEEDASTFWNQFYGKHENKFFKDRHWLFTEFPELSPEAYLSKEELNRLSEHYSATSQSVKGQEETSCCFTTRLQETDQTVQSDLSPCKCNAGGQDGEGLHSEIHTCAACSKSLEANTLTVQNLTKDPCVISQGQNSNTVCVTELAVDGQSLSSKPLQAFRNTSIVESNDSVTDGQGALEAFPGQSARYRILEVGCGVGNTVFPILQANNDPSLMVYCCDYSCTAVQLVKENKDYNPSRCHAFVCDISDPEASVPFPEGSLDVIVMIFILSANNPDKFQVILNRLASFLKPGGMILFRDYGRYDLAQLRFKKGKCLGENFYVRGDGTRVYFFTQEEVRKLMTQAGLVEIQNLVDRRLQVNRGKQLKMYRVWIQCKYRKPCEIEGQQQNNINNILPGQQGTIHCEQSELKNEIGETGQENSVTAQDLCCHGSSSENER